MGAGRRRAAAGVLILAGAVLVVAPSAQARPASCGAVVLKGPDTDSLRGVIEVVGGGYSCRMARAVIRAANAGPFTFGAALPSRNGWHCMASLRPEVGYHPRDVVGCWHGRGERSYQVGVRLPAAR